MNKDELMKRSFVSSLVEFVDRSKNRGMNAVFQAEKMGGLFDKDVGNALVEALYGTIKRDELRNRLVRASERYNPQDKRYRNIIKFAASSDNDFLAEPDKEGVKNTGFSKPPESPQPQEPIYLEPLPRLKTGAASKPSIVGEFSKNVMEGLGPRIPSPSGMAETLVHTVFAIKVIKNNNQRGYIEQAELVGFGEENDFYHFVSPAFREMVKKGLIK